MNIIAIIASRKSRLSAIILAVFLIACSACHSGSPEKSEVKRVWTAADRPSLLSEGFIFEYSKLPRNGWAKTTPWTGSYWPTYRDSINDRWGGTASESPAKKYEMAFKVPFNVENAVSRAYGIDSLSAKECTASDQCEFENVCAKRFGQNTGKCIPTWFGICHAWAPAAIAEPEPVNAVMYNGVEFKVNDIKALVTYAYNAGYASKYMSLRCNEKSDKMRYDMYGNPVDSACIDTNPGSFHVVLANLLGIRKTSFIEDRVFDEEVWNHPVRAYRVALDKEVSAEQASDLIGLLGDIISQDKKSGSITEKQWSEAWSYNVKSPDGVTADGVAVAMRGSGDADLYVRFDAEPTFRAYHCRSTAERSEEYCNLKIRPGVSKVWVKVYGYKGNSDYIVNIRMMKKNTQGYQLNPKAVSFRHLITYVAYVAESSQSTDGNLASFIDHYTNIDTYDYILEMNDKGAIIGGEWLGTSRKNHPDFLWITLERKDVSISGMRWADIKMLLNKSIAPTVTVPPEIDYCTANNGRGEGDIFDCVIRGTVQKCARTDLTLAVSCISRVNPPSRNLVDNPGFEMESGANLRTIAGWNSWTSNSALAANFLDRNSPHSGNFKLTQFADEDYEVYTYQTKTGLADGVYTLKAWVTGSGGQRHAFMEAKDYGGRNLYQNIPASDAWQQISIDNINVIGGQCTLGFYSNARGGQWISFDDVEFYKISR